MPAPGANTFTATRPSRSAIVSTSRLERDTAHSRHVGHAGDAMHDGTENDRCDEDADRLDEGLAERLHTHAGIGIEVAERDAERHRHEHEEPKLQVEGRRALGLDRARRNGLISV